MAPRARESSNPIDAQVYAYGKAHPDPKSGAGNAITGGHIQDLDPNAEVRGSLWYGDPQNVGLAAQMQRDPIVRWCVAGYIGPLIGATWDFEPASDKPADVEAAHYQYYNWFERNDFLGLVSRGGKGCANDGSVCFELTDDVSPIDRSRFPLHPGKGTGIIYTGFHHRPRWTIDEWIQSPTDAAKIVGFKQFLKGSDAEKMGAREVRLDRGDLILRLTWDQDAANFDGFPVLRSAWSPFKRKRVWHLIAAIRHEREGAPIAMIEEPENGDTPEQTERETADEIAQNVRAHEQGFVRVPKGWKLSWLSGSGNDTGLRQDTDNCDFEIAFVFGLGWMLLGRGKTGSWALGDVQKGHGILTAQRQAKFWEYALNVGFDSFSPVRRSHELNYGPDVGCPKAVVRYVPVENGSELLNTIPALVNCGVLTPDDVLEDRVRIVLAAGPRDAKTARKKPELTGPPTVTPPQPEPGDDDDADEPEDE